MLKKMEGFVEILSESILQKTKLINEVIISVIDGHEEVKWEKRGVKFQKINCCTPYGTNHQHALGLHECLNHTNNKYIMFCDPDIFFNTSVDEIYLEIIKKYNLDLIGVSHHAATNQAYSYFPCVMNMLVEKAALPDNVFLKGHLRIRNSILKDTPIPDESTLEQMDGKYLLAGPIKDYANSFPNKNENCNFDIGCNLYLWSEQQNWKWLAFQTLDCHWYDTTYFRSNVKNLKIPPKQKLLYHNVAGAMSSANEIAKIYKGSIND
jgi:hypothetical protein